MKWNYRICKFKANDLEKIGIFEVYYNNDGTILTRKVKPILSWYVNKCDAQIPTVEQACKEANWDVKSMLKAFRAPMLDAEKDF